MAKGSGDSKLAWWRALTLAVALAGVLLVKEPLRSSRPVGTGLDMNQTTGEQLVRARLWEDPVAAVERAMRGTSATSNRVVQTAASRLNRPSLNGSDHSGRRSSSESRTDERLTVLLVTTSGDPYAESTESRIRDRYAVGTALGVACYVPEDEAISPSSSGTLRALFMRCRMNGIGSARHASVAKTGSSPEHVSSSGCPTTPSVEGSWPP